MPQKSISEIKQEWKLYFKHFNLKFCQENLPSGYFSSGKCAEKNLITWRLPKFEKLKTLYTTHYTTMQKYENYGFLHNQLPNFLLTFYENDIELTDSRIIIPLLMR